MEAEPYNNFVKQLRNACIPSKREEEDKVEYVEPNFVTSQEYLQEMKQGDWKRFSDIKLEEGFDAKEEYQISDGEGYELIPFFNYGVGMKYSTTSTVEDKSTDDAENSNKTNAEKAQSIVPDKIRLTINPNNNAMRLDDEDTSMLNFFETSETTKAQKAYDLSPVDYN